MRSAHTPRCKQSSTSMRPDFAIFFNMYTVQSKRIRTVVPDTGCIQTTANRQLNAGFIQPRPRPMRKKNLVSHRWSRRL